MLSAVKLPTVHADALTFDCVSDASVSNGVAITGSVLTVPNDVLGNTNMPLFTSKYAVVDFAISPASSSSLSEIKPLS